MNCLECQEMMHRRMDGERMAASPALDQHLSECTDCRTLQTGAKRLLEGLKKLPVPRLPADFAREITAKVMHDRRHRRAKMQRRLYVMVGLAASVVLLLVMAYQWYPRPGHEKQAQDFAKEKEQAAPPAPAVVPKKSPEPKHLQVPEPKQVPRNALASLTNRLADTTRDHAQVVLVGTNLDAVEKLPAVNELPMLEPSVREAGQEVSDGVRTVTRNARKAFDFFARELPMPEIGEQRN